MIEAFIVRATLDEWTCPACRQMDGKPVPAGFKPHAHCVRRIDRGNTVICRCEVVSAEAEARRARPRTPCRRRGGCVFLRYGWCEGCREETCGHQWIDPAAALALVWWTGPAPAAVCMWCHTFKEGAPT